jgi:D-ribose pyranose/furanose isomerase RbsD
MSEKSTIPRWALKLCDALTLFGHRNWIVVADAAYPVQSRPGIEMIDTNAQQIDVLRSVLDFVADSSHIRANVFLDHELEFVSEKDAPGVANYRHELQAVLGDSLIVKLPHEQIIHKLDEAAQVFRVLILKTKMAIPYTSVFLELDCGYWSAEAEARLRATIASAEAS